MSGVAASADVFRAVADPTRRALLDLLYESERSVAELADPFRMTQPAISQHLRILRQAGLVRARQVGRQRLYRINPKPVEEVYEWAAHYKRFADPFGHAWAFVTEKAEAARSPRQVVRGAFGQGAGRRQRNRIHSKEIRDDLMITHAKTVGVCVRDQQKALEFYTEKLGFEVRRNEAMGPDARWIEVAPRGAQTCIVPYTPPGWESRIGTFANVVFSCKDVEATYKELTARGVEFSEKPAKQPWGGIMAQFKDQDGNTFVLVQD